MVTQRNYLQQRSVQNKELIIYFVKALQRVVQSKPEQSRGERKNQKNTGAVGWVATVTVSVNKIEGLNGGRGIMKRSISLPRSTPSSQLHPLPQVPLAYRHRAGRQYPGIPTSGNIAVIARVKTPGPTSSCTSSSPSRVTPHDSDTFQLPASSSSSELSARWSSLLWSRHYFSQTATWPAPP